MPIAHGKVIRASGCFAVIVSLAAAAGSARNSMPEAAADFDIQELAGSWHATFGSRLRLLVFSPFRRFAEEEHLIVLDHQGSCRFRSHWQYSYIDEGRTEDDAYFDTGSCEWHIAETPVRRNGVLGSEYAVTLAVRQGKKAIDTVYLNGMRGRKPTLWQRIGEPWMSAYMEFEQRR